MHCSRAEICKIACVDLKMSFRTRCKAVNSGQHSQGKQLGHVTEAVVGQRADLVVTQITEKENRYIKHSHALTNTVNSALQWVIGQDITHQALHTNELLEKMTVSFGPKAKCRKKHHSSHDPDQYKTMFMSYLST